MLLSSDTKNCPVKLYMSTLGSTQSIQSCKSRLNRVAKMHGSDFDSCGLLGGSRAKFVGAERYG